MLYESQGIFPEGWAFDFRQEARSVTHQHATSARSRTPKAKREADCQECGKTFIVKGKALGKFCSRACNYARKKRVTPDWMECSRCFAKAGIGMTLGARLLRTSKKQIHEFWKKEGIVRIAPKSGEWRRYAQRAKSPVCGWWGNAETAAMWISEYNPRFPDWSAVWSYEKLLRYQRAKYHAMTPDQKSKHNQNWKKIDPSVRRERIKKWKERNPERVLELGRSSQRKMRQDPMKRIIINMRRRFKEIMNGVRESPTQGRWELIGCSQDQLKSHLESGFKKGMSWANYGKYWHVDHILPCSSFDHRDPNQLKQCWHWTNLRPLEAAKNIAKNDSITEPQMSLLLCSTH
jgi:hypothetical protein